MARTYGQSMRYIYRNRVTELIILEEYANMARYRKNTFNKKVIEAIISTPFIVLGSRKRKRSAAKKWMGVMNQAIKK